MISSITLTSSMRSNLSSLKSLASQMSTTQVRLSTGKKVNNAIDNANSYYQARALTNRASDLDMLLDAMGQSIQTVTTAVHGLEKSAEILENAAVIAKETYEAAIIPEKAWFEAQVGPNGAVVTTAQELKDAIAANKETICVYGKIDLGEITSGLTLKANQKLVGVGYFGDFDSEVDKFSSISANSLSDINFIYNSASNVEISDLTINYSNNSASHKSCISNAGDMIIGNIEVNYKKFETGYWIYNISNGNKMTLKGNIVVNNNKGVHDRGIDSGRNGVLIIKEGAEIKGSVGNSNCILESLGICDIYGSIKGRLIFDEGSLNVHSSALLDDPDIRINIPAIHEKGAVITINNKSYQLTEDTVCSSSYNGRNIASLLPVEKLSEAQHIYSPVKKPRGDEKVLAQSVEQYLTAMSAFDEMVSDSSYQGVNLLKGGKLTTMFNEDRTHSYTVEGKDMSLSGLGITTREWVTKDDIAASIKEIQNAMNAIRDEVARLGNHLSIIETRMNFTDGLVDVLQTGADDLVLADMNEESANYLALQTRNNLAVNALALAAQSNNAVLKLF